MLYHKKCISLQRKKKSMKEYHISIFDGKNVVLTKDIERRGLDYFKEDYKTAWMRRYIIEVGDKVIDIFGNIVTIKEILHHESTKTTNFLVEENGNCYNPWEFAGLFVRYLSNEDFERLINIEKEN